MIKPDMRYDLLKGHVPDVETLCGVIGRRNAEEGISPERAKYVLEMSQCRYL